MHRKAGRAIQQLVGHRKALFTGFGIACGHIGLGCRPCDCAAVCRLGRQAFHDLLPAVRRCSAGHGVHFVPHRTAAHHRAQGQIKFARPGIVGIAVIHPVFRQRQIAAAVIGIGNGHGRAVCAVCRLLAAGIVCLPVAGDLLYRVGIAHAVFINRKVVKGVGPLALCVGCQSYRAAHIDIILFQLQLNAGRAGQVLHGVVTAPHLFNRQAGAAIQQLVCHGKALLTGLGIARGHILFRRRPSNRAAVCRFSRHTSGNLLPAVCGCRPSQGIIFTPH